MDSLAELVGESPVVSAIRENIRKLLARQHGARRLPSILIEGETGTGKGLVARLIHRAGPRAGGPFVDVNCAAIPDALLEAELFGYERGAFTDARRAKPGLFQTAHRGTIFLDEVALLPEGLQAKLLKVIEEQAVRRLGSTESEPVDAWIIAATNTDLQAAIRDRTFREDLYHRLAVLTLRLPSLKERGTDILLLAERFLARACADYGLPPKILAADAHARLLGYPWPGNVRELSNVIERAALLAEGQVVTGSMLDLPEQEMPEPGALPGQAAGPAVSLDEAMRDHLEAVLEQTGWNISRSAALLGISRNTLRSRIEKLGLRSGAAPGGPLRRAERAQPPVPPLPAPGLGHGLAPAPIRWERRRITLLRATLSAQEGVDTGASDTGTGLEILIDKVRNFGGRVEELHRSGIAASFGFGAVEDAPRRAANAAMAIQKAAERARRDERQRFMVRIAIHVEQLPVGQSNGEPEIDADAKRAQLSVLDALLRSAEPDSIVASADAARFLERRFDLVPLRAPGGEPWSTYRLTGRERAGLGLGGRMARFVGRSYEVESLERRAAAALRGNGQVVALVGDPGVGKSRLAWEFSHSHRAHEWLHLQTGSVSYGKGTSYLPVIELVRSYFQIEEDDEARKISDKITRRVLALDEALAPAIPSFLALVDLPVADEQWQELDPPQRRQRTLGAVKSLLLRQSRVQPVLLVFEDLHWVDSETQALLDGLVEDLPAAHLLLLVTYRPEYEHGWGSKGFYTQLRVEPLPPENAEELLHALLGQDTGLRPLKPLLVRWTEGNPFFLEESVRALVESGSLVGERGAYRLATPLPNIRVPATVEQVLAARIGRLRSEDKHLLQSAAVVGTEAPLPILEAITEMPEESLRRGLGRLQAAEFVSETSSFPWREYTFRHALTHEVAYEGLLPERRRALHARIVTAMETLYPDRRAEQVDRLAHHAFRGEVWDKAAVYLRQAGAKALGRSANREAAACFEQALIALAHLRESPQTLGQSIDVRFELRTALTPLGEHERIFDSLLEAEGLAARLGDQLRAGRVCAYMTDYLRLVGEHERAIESGQRALEIARTLEERSLEIWANTYLGQVHHHRGEYRQAADLFRQNVSSLQGELSRESFGLPQVPSVHSRAWLVLCLAELGEFAEGQAVGEESARIAESLDHPLSMIAACAGLGGLYLRRGDLERAIPIIERGLELGRQWDTWLWFPWLASCLGSAYAWAGRLADAMPLLEQAVERAASMKRMGGHAARLCALAEAYLLGGRTADAIERAGVGLELARRHGERGHEAWVLRLLGEIALHADPPDVERARACCREAMALAEGLGMRPLVAHCHAGLARIHLRAGESGEAELRLAAASALYRDMEMRWWLEKATVGSAG